MLIRLLGDVLSPPRCASCDAEVRRDHVFCAACAATVETVADGASIDVAFGYYGGALATAIRRMKYEDRPYLARPLGELLRGACRAAGVAADLVVPVPLHARRLVERGYNQAALLAAYVARELAVPLDTTALQRNAETMAQAQLSGAQRQTNVERAMTVTAPHAIEGRTIALVDDVATTGATLRACRDALFGAGASRVVGVILARTSVATPLIPLGLDAEPSWT